MKEDKTNINTSESFEIKIGRLQAIVDKLEGDPSLSLEDGMALFENGLKLTKECVEELNVTRERIADLDRQLEAVLDNPLFGGDNE